jgi:DNA processing protein
MTDDLPYWIAFSVFPGIGPMRFRLLLEYFTTAKRAYTATDKELRGVGLGDGLIQKFVDFRTKFTIDSYLLELQKKQIRVLHWENPDYPKRLKETSDAPFVLYCFGKGDLSLLSHPKLIAVVGTRAITSYGASVTEQITKTLLDAGCLIVSGMALGVDGLAHRTALAAQTPTVAVLGCGVDIIAPSSHASLYYKIAQTGLVVSEMPLSLLPGKGLFPARNRIISGLSVGVLVTEGAEDSGSLITARYAAEQGREVFAVPGPITSSLSAGPMSLIKNGATLVTRGEDILDSLGFGGKKVHTPLDVSKYTKEEQGILCALEDSPKTFDELVFASHLPSAKLSMVLTKLELSEVIKQYDDTAYRLTLIPF